MRPSRTTGTKGEAIPPAPTVSMCAFSIRDRPPPDPRSTPTTEGRPGRAAITETSRPIPRSHVATYAAIATSPDPDGTRSGLTDSIATRPEIRSVSSSTRSGELSRQPTLPQNQEQTDYLQDLGRRSQDGTRRVTDIVNNTRETERIEARNA